MTFIRVSLKIRPLAIVESASLIKRFEFVSKRLFERLTLNGFGGKELFAGFLQGQNFPMLSRELIAPLVVARESWNQPDDVAVVQVATWGGAGASDRLEEWAIHRNGHLRSPAPKSWDLDLQLRHKAFRARRAPIRAANCIRKRGFSMIIIPHAHELGFHALARKVHGLDFQPIPLQSAAGHLGDNKIDFPRRPVRARPPHERHLAGHHRLRPVKNRRSRQGMAPTGHGYVQGRVRLQVFD